jgi:hypothetical protein
MPRRLDCARSSRAWRAANAGIDQEMHHGGEYAAKLVGKEWPGPVKWE